jgi:alkanesulfonate monooxygenase SsuD/methylene tetrahydromethanopterin reductase-like flavin-dependent oxidoreductase (luciferase family)
MTKGVDLDTYLDINLVGTPDQVCAKVDAFRRAGLDQFTALLFVGNTVEEMRDQMRRFAKFVLPAFPD